MPDEIEAELRKGLHQVHECRGGHCPDDRRSDRLRRGRPAPLFGQEAFAESVARVDHVQDALPPIRRHDRDFDDAPVEEIYLIGPLAHVKDKPAGPVAANLQGPRYLADLLRRQAREQADMAEVRSRVLCPHASPPHGYLAAITIAEIFV